MITYLVLLAQNICDKARLLTEGNTNVKFSANIGGQLLKHELVLW